MNNCYETPSKQIAAIRAQIADLQKRERDLGTAHRIEKILRLCDSPNPGEAQAAQAALKKFHWASVRKVRNQLETEKLLEETKRRGADNLRRWTEGGIFTRR
jgi:hypothetical protein